jgi:hypothetical protein
MKVNTAAEGSLVDQKCAKMEGEEEENAECAEAVKEGGWCLQL